MMLTALDGEAVADDVDSETSDAGRAHGPLGIRALPDRADGNEGLVVVTLRAR